jgi:hypothetical protein
VKLTESFRTIDSYKKESNTARAERDAAQHASPGMPKLPLRPRQS